MTFRGSGIKRIVSLAQNQSSRRLFGSTLADRSFSTGHHFQISGEPGILVMQTTNVFPC